MKSFVGGSLLSAVVFYSCSSSKPENKRQVEKIAAAVKSCPAFAGSDLQDFKELDTLFITANELPRYRRLLDDISVYDSLLADAEKIRNGKPVTNDMVSEDKKEDMGGFIETVKYEKESKKNELTKLIDNATDTIYKIECTENLKSDGKTVSTTHAIVYVNSDMKVIDYWH